MQCFASATASSFPEAMVEGGLRHNGQVSTSRINAGTPTRPLPHGNDFVPAILVGFCCGHEWASQKR